MNFRAKTNYPKLVQKVKINCKRMTSVIKVAALLFCLLLSSNTCNSWFRRFGRFNGIVYSRSKRFFSVEREKMTSVIFHFQSVKSCAITFIQKNMTKIHHPLLSNSHVGKQEMMMMTTNEACVPCELTQRN